MSEFDNNYDHNNTESYNRAQNSGYAYNTGGNFYSSPEFGGVSQNEFSYTPVKPHKKAAKRILTAVLAVMFIGAVSVTSIIGYNMMTGKNSPGADNGDKADNPANVSAADDSAQTPAASKPLPTLEQLAAPEDALKIPEIIDKMSPSVVGISCITNKGVFTGSGIVLSEDGYIITNAHVIDGAQSIAVLLPTNYLSGSDGDESELTYEARLVGSDEQTDIAVVKIKTDKLIKAEIGRSEDIRVGELSIVIGNPLGLDLTNSATAGIISAKDRTITIEDRTMKVLQTDASINHGNSGGPLINAYGQVIGITSAKVADSEVEGLGFAIPIDDAIPIINDLIQNGYVTGRPSLGITGSNITSAYSSYYGIPQGFLVREVTPGSCAQISGIQVGDVIIAINDTVISNINELNDIKNTFKPGDSIMLTVYRNGRKVDISVVLDEFSENNSVGSNSGDPDPFGSGYGDNYFDPYDYFDGY